MNGIDRPGERELTKSRQERRPRRFRRPFLDILLVVLVVLGLVELPGTLLGGRTYRELLPPPVLTLTANVEDGTYRLGQTITLTATVDSGATITGLEYSPGQSFQAVARSYNCKAEAAVRYVSVEIRDAQGNVIGREWDDIDLDATLTLTVAIPTPTPQPTATPLPTATLVATATPIPTVTPIPTATSRPTYKMQVKGERDDYYVGRTYVFTIIITLSTTGEVIGSDSIIFQPIMATSYRIVFSIELDTGETYDGTFSVSVQNIRTTPTPVLKPTPSVEPTPDCEELRQDLQNLLATAINLENEFEALSEQLAQVMMEIETVNLELSNLLSSLPEESYGELMEKLEALNEDEVLESLEECIEAWIESNVTREYVHSLGEELLGKPIDMVKDYAAEKMLAEIAGENVALAYKVKGVVKLQAGIIQDFIAYVNKEIQCWFLPEDLERLAQILQYKEYLSKWEKYRELNDELQTLSRQDRELSAESAHINAEIELILLQIDVIRLQLQYCNNDN